MRRVGINLNLVVVYCININSVTLVYGAKLKSYRVASKVAFNSNVTAIQKSYRLIRIFGLLLWRNVAYYPIRFAKSFTRPDVARAQNTESINLKCNPRL